MFYSSAQANLVYAIKLLPNQAEPFSMLAFLMQEVELDDAKYSRDYVGKIEEHLVAWLALDDESDPDNPVVIEQEKAEATQNIERQRIDGQFEVQYGSTKLPAGFVSATAKKQRLIAKILRLLDPYNRLQPYIIKQTTLRT